MSSGALLIFEEYMEKESSLFEDLKTGLVEAIAYKKGQATATARTVNIRTIKKDSAVTTEQEHPMSDQGV